MKNSELLMLAEFINHLRDIYETVGDVPVALIHRDLSFSKIGDVGIMEIKSLEDTSNHTETCCGILDGFSFDDIIEEER